MNVDQQITYYLLQTCRCRDQAVPAHNRFCGQKTEAMTQRVSILEGLAMTPNFLFRLDIPFSILPAEDDLAAES
jgi:ABC-type taurine transport system ATPase subunit